MKMRVILNLPRVGGTLFSRIISRNDDVVLLSEVHPQRGGVDVMQSLVENGYEAVGAGSEAGWTQSILRASEIEGKKVVIRDHSHVNFTAETGRSYAFETLASLSGFDVSALALTRHPVDQYLSCMSRAALPKYLTIDNFMEGYLRFHDALGDVPVLKYEDLVAAPRACVQAACGHLQLEFQADMLADFASVKTVSGDRDQPSRAYQDATLVSLPRRDGYGPIAAAFGANPAFGGLLDRLGYEL